MFEGITGKPIEEYIRGVDDTQFYADLKKFAEWLKVQEVRRHSKPIPGTKLTQNTIKTRLASIRSYGKENGLIIGKTHYKALFDVSTKGRLIKDAINDQAFTLEQARDVYGKLSLPMKSLFLTLFCSGLRVNEALQIRLEYKDENGNIKSDIDWLKKPVQIFIPAENTKTDTERTVIISTECANLLKDEWLPYISTYSGFAMKRGGFTEVSVLEKKYAGRLFPMTESNFRLALMRACSLVKLNAGKRNEHHVHSLRKSFRTIVGLINPDVAEFLLGHADPLNYRKLTIEKCIPFYTKAEPGLTIGGTIDRETDSRDAEIQALKDQIRELSRKIDKREDRANREHSKEKSPKPEPKKEEEPPKVKTEIKTYQPNPEFTEKENKQLKKFMDEHTDEAITIFEELDNEEKKIFLLMRPNRKADFFQVYYQYKKGVHFALAVSQPPEK
ncbi:site-specific integrase [Patescibacteria group bacterium]|nr:site-specific integrase [Patescibacteria group bacterium]